jgi:flagellar motor component MotA
LKLRRRREGMVKLDDILIEIQELEFLNRALKMQMIKNDNKIRELEDEMVKIDEERKKNES